jgi:hypothetical protein
MIVYGLAALLLHTLIEWITDRLAGQTESRSSSALRGTSRQRGGMRSGRA